MLFEELRKLRRKLARERGMPAYIIFSDTTLQDLPTRRPSTPAALLLVSGIGMKKRGQYEGANTQDNTESLCQEIAEDQIFLHAFVTFALLKQLI